MSILKGKSTSPVYARQDEDGNILGYVDENGNILVMGGVSEDELGTPNGIATLDSNGKLAQILPLVDSTNNAITYNGTQLYVSKTDLASFMGIATFESVIGSETTLTPIVNKGDRIFVGGIMFRRVYVGEFSETNFAYVLTQTETINVSSINLANANNSSTTVRQIGALVIPADALRWTTGATVTITVTLNGAAANTVLGMGFDKNRVSTSYRVTKVQGSGVTATTVTMTLNLNSYSMTKLKLSDDGSANVPTNYPYASKKISCNQLRTVTLPIYFNWSTAASGIAVTGLTASIKVAPPARFKKVSGTSYREAAKQPHPANDFWNRPVGTNLVLRKPSFCHNPATTSGSGNTSGSINAQGTAASTDITVYDSSRVKVGQIPCFTQIYDAVNVSPKKSYFTYLESQYATFGADVYVTQIVDATTVRLNKAVKTSFVRRGKESWGAIYALTFFDPETLDIQGGAAANAHNIHFGTGTVKSSTNATSWAIRMPIFRSTPTDPITQMRAASFLTANGWLGPIADANVGGGGETVLAQDFFMRVPAGLTDANVAAGNNADKDVMIITEDGRFSVEGIGWVYNSANSRWSVARMVVHDLNDNSCPYMFDDLAWINSGDTQGCRAGGGGYLSGIVRLEEIKKVPDSAVTTYTNQQLLDAIEICKTAIPHAISLLYSTSQQLSVNYAPDPAVQGTRTTYKAYISQFERDTPAIKTAGSGYVVGDVMYFGAAADATTPMRVVVTAVTAGAVTAIKVAACGQFKNIPADAGNLTQTSTSGVGTGCVLNALSTGNAAVTTTALAFPNLGVMAAFHAPAQITDSAWNTQGAGTLAMGAVFVIDPTRDLAAEFLAARTADQTSANNSFEMLAIRYAMQRYGAVVMDTSINTEILVGVENDFTGYWTNKWKWITGDTASTGVMSNINNLRHELLLVDNVVHNAPTTTYPSGHVSKGTTVSTVGTNLELYPINN